MGRKVFIAAFVFFTLAIASLIASVNTISADETSMSRYWKTGPVLQQNGYECVGYALAGFLEAEPNSYIQHPSPYWIYFGAKARDGLNIPWNAGTTAEAGVQYLEDEGYVQTFTTTTNIMQMRDWILNNGPIVIEAAWTESMSHPDKTGLVGVYGKYPFQHAWECYGFDGATYSFWCQNSWGIRYGIRGTFRINIAGMQQLETIFLRAVLITKNTNL